MLPMRWLYFHGVETIAIELCYNCTLGLWRNINTSTCTITFGSPRIMGVCSAFVERTSFNHWKMSIAVSIFLYEHQPLLTRVIC